MLEIRVQSEQSNIIKNLESFNRYIDKRKINRTKLLKYIILGCTV